MEFNCNYLFIFQKNLIIAAYVWVDRKKMFIVLNVFFEIEIYSFLLKITLSPKISFIYLMCFVFVMFTNEANLS